MLFGIDKIVKICYIILGNVRYSQFPMSTENPTPPTPEKSIDLLPWTVLVSYVMVGFGFSIGIGAFGPEYPKGEQSPSQLVIGVCTSMVWPAIALHQIGRKLGETLKTSE